MPNDRGIIKLDHARVTEIRKASGCGMIEARQVATNEALLEAVESARTVEDLKPILRALILKTL